MIKISICIATWNRKDMLFDIVELLEHQTMKQDDYEIIVTDSNSNDGTDTTMEVLQKKYNNIVYLRDVDNILAAKRNAGIKAAKSDIVVFMDDDVYPLPGFIEAHYRANIDNANTFWCGQIRFPSDKVICSNYYRFRDQQHLDEKSIGLDLPYNRIVVMNLSFRKSFINDVGFVDERFLGYGCEDIEFGYRVKNSGYRLRYLPDASAIHMENSNGIVEYGNKLYKCGLYGDRTLKEIRPELETMNRLYRAINACVSVKLIQNLLCSYLVKSDAIRFLYSYKLFKLYIKSRQYQGLMDQKKVEPLSINSLSKGW